MADFNFKKATRAAKKWRILLRGVSGGGKTMSALILANELKGKGRVLVVDTEKASSTHLADKFDFDLCDYNELSGNNHHPAGYIKLLDKAEETGYTVVIIDSFSHVWMGQNGILDLVQALTDTKYKGNSYRAWSDGNALYQSLINKLFYGNNMHIIVTARTKQAYEMQDGENNKKQVVKKSMDTQQRDGLDYEFDSVLNFENSKPGYAVPEKDRTGIFTVEGDMITPAIGKKMMNYLNTATKDEKNSN